MCWYHILSAIVDYIFRFYTFILCVRRENFCRFYFYFFLCRTLRGVDALDIGMEENRISEMEESWPSKRLMKKKSFSHSLAKLHTIISNETDTLLGYNSIEFRHIVQHQSPPQTIVCVRALLQHGAEMTS